MAAVRERLKAAPYDLVLLDLRLPDGDGLEAIPQCRELAPDTPIIAMTAYAVRHAATEALRRGAYDFFTKPLKIAELEIVVGDRKSTRLNSSHVRISYAVFCLKKKKRREHYSYRKSTTTFT